MTAAFEELRVQAENDRSEMSFKCENSVYCVYAAGSILYFIACVPHAGSGQTDVKGWNGEQVTLRHWDPSFIHAAFVHCLAPSVAVPLGQIWNFIFQTVTQH